MQDRMNNETVLAIFVAVAAATLVMFGAVLYLGHRNFWSNVRGIEANAEAAAPQAESVAQKPTEPREPQQPTQAAAQPGTAGTQAAAMQQQMQPSVPAVEMARVDELPLGDPHAAAWSQAEAVDVPVMPQVMAMPTLDTPSISTVRVQAMTDDEHVAWRLSWTDESADMNVDAGRFCDAVAIQFPLTQGAPFTMGAEGMKVQVLHWKAVWQKDVDEHFQDVQDLHPNYWADLYWFAEGGPPYRVPDDFKSEAARQYLLGFAAGNPMSDFHRKQPVEELVAEGFGTLTHQPESASAGRGVWKDGRWAVVFARPLQTDDPLDFQFDGSGGQISVAVWEGSAGNVGGRKHWSTWVPFEVNK